MPSFLINELNNGTFKNVFQTGIVLFSRIEEMGNRGTVAETVLFKIDGFSMVSNRKNGYQYGHDMLHGRLWEKTAQT